MEMTAGHLRERMEAVAELMNKEKGAEGVQGVIDASKINSVHICALCVKREKKRAARRREWEEYLAKREVRLEMRRRKEKAEMNRGALI